MFFWAAGNLMFLDKEHYITIHLGKLFEKLFLMFPRVRPSFSPFKKVKRGLNGISIFPLKHRSWCVGTPLASASFVGLSLIGRQSR